MYYTSILIRRNDLKNLFLQQKFEDTAGKGYPVGLKKLFSMNSAKSTLKGFLGRVEDEVASIKDIFSSAFKLGFLSTPQQLFHVNARLSGRLNGLAVTGWKQDHEADESFVRSLYIFNRMLLNTTFLSLPEMIRESYAVLQSFLNNTETYLHTEYTATVDEIHEINEKIAEQHELAEETEEFIAEFEAQEDVVEDMLRIKETAYLDAQAELKAAADKLNHSELSYDETARLFEKMRERILRDENDRFVRWDTENEVFYCIQVDGEKRIYDAERQEEYRSIFTNVDVTASFDEHIDLAHSNMTIPGNNYEIIKERKELAEASVYEARVCHNGACEIVTRIAEEKNEALTTLDNIRSTLRAHQRTLLKIQSEMKALDDIRHDQIEGLEAIKQKLEDIRDLRRTYNNPEVLEGLRDGSITVDDLEDELRKTPNLFRKYEAFAEAREQEGDTSLSMTFKHRHDHAELRNHDADVVIPNMPYNDLKQLQPA